MTNNPRQDLDRLAQALFDKKAKNILAIDVQGITVMTDFFLIADGNVSRHVKALGNQVQEQMKELGWELFHAEGENGDWMVLDYGWVMIHLFTPALRDKYRVETFWSKGDIVDLHIQVSEGQVSE